MEVVFTSVPLCIYLSIHIHIQHKGSPDAVPATTSAFQGSIVPPATKCALPGSQNASLVDLHFRLHTALR